MTRFILSLLCLSGVLAACNSRQNTSSPEVPSKEQISLAGNGYLQLELKINDEPVITDSAKYTVHDVDGLLLESWGERLQQGAYAYTYKFEMRLHSFHGAGKYAMTNEYGTMFWQYKSFYIQPSDPGTFTADNWSSDRISGEFHFVADDGYGDKRRVDGRFFQR